MKKFIWFSLLGLLVMAFSTSVYAMDFKASGFIDSQWNYNLNATGGNAAAGIYDALPSAFKFGSPVAIGTLLLPVRGGQQDKKVNYFMSRARLKFDAIMDKNLMGTIYFEMDSNRWGEPSPAADQRNGMGYWSGDRGAVEVKNVYVDFGLPYVGIPMPMTFRVGLQPISIRNNIFLYTDGMGIIWTTKIDPAAIQLIYAKPYEGRDWAAQDDVDVLGAHLTAKFGTISAGGYALYYNMNAYPFNAITAGTASGYSGSFDAGMWWFGAYMDGKLGPVNVNLDGIFDRGKVQARPSGVGFPAIIGYPDVKYRGWAFRAKFDFPWEKFNFGLTGYYASGADTEDTSSSGLPGSATSLGTPSRKVRSFVVPPGSEAGAIFGESVVFYSYSGNRGTTGIGNSNNYNALCRGPLGGTWMAKVYASAKAAPWYKITVQGMYIGDTTKNGDTFGTSRTLALPLVSPLKDSKDIGWEIDLINEIQIYKNLKLTVAGGYLFAGEAMDQFTNTGFGIIPINDEIKNPWAITWNLTYTF